MIILFGILTIVAIIHFIVLIAYAGFAASFAFFWLLLAIICLVITGALYGIRKKNIHIPLFWNVFIKTTVALGILVFCIIQMLIFTQMNAYPNKEVDTLVVLGARLYGEKPSPVLQDRLDAAYTYLEECEEVNVIVCGGKGNDESISEAQAMKEYLVAKGIDVDRIIVEDTSINTAENIAFAKELIKEDISVAVVTSGFHMYRAKKLFKKQGFRDITGIAAKENIKLLPNNCVREFFAIMKDMIFKNI